MPAGPLFRRTLAPLYYPARAYSYEEHTDAVVTWLRLCRARVERGETCHEAVARRVVRVALWLADPRCPKEFAADDVPAALPWSPEDVRDFLSFGLTPATIADAMGITANLVRAYGAVVA